MMNRQELYDVILKELLEDYKKGAGCSIGSSSSTNHVIQILAKIETGKKLKDMEEEEAAYKVWKERHKVR